MREQRMGFDRRNEEDDVRYYDEQDDFGRGRGDRMNESQRFRDRERRQSFDSPRNEGFRERWGQHGFGETYGQSTRGEQADYSQTFGPSYGRSQTFGSSYAQSQRGGPDFTGRGPRSFRRSDERIYDEIGDRLTQDPRIDASGIDIEVRDGTVFLRGTVLDREQKRRAEDIIDSVGGVKDVRNEIRVSDRQSERQGYEGRELEGRDRFGVGTGFGQSEWVDRAGQRYTVAGVFRDMGQAERAINELKSLGFTREDISFVTKDRGLQTEGKGVEGAETKGAGTGALLGGLGGGALGWLLGIGAIAIPGVGPIVAGGAIATAIAGAAAGAVAGGLLGALVGAGVPENEAKEYEKVIKEGGVLVTVMCTSDEERDRAKDVLRRLGADKVNDFRGKDSDMARAGSGNGHGRELSGRR